MYVYSIGLKTINNTVMEKLNRRLVALQQYIYKWFISIYNRTYTCLYKLY